MAITRPRAEALAAELDLDVDSGICLACLCMVSFSLEGDDAGEIERLVRRMTKDLWHEGLREHALAAVREACVRGLVDADAALADLEERRAAGVTARAIVRRLGFLLLEHIRIEARIREVARGRLRAARPELN